MTPIQLLLISIMIMIVSSVRLANLARSWLPSPLRSACQISDQQSNVSGSYISEIPSELRSEIYDRLMMKLSTEDAITMLNSPSQLNNDKSPVVIPLVVLSNPLSSDKAICESFKCLLNHSDIVKSMTEWRTDLISERQSRHLITVLINNDHLDTIESIEFVMSLLPNVNRSIVADLMLRQSLRDLLRLDNPTRSIHRFNLLDMDSRASAITRIAEMDCTDILDVFEPDDISAAIIRQFLEHVRRIPVGSMLTLPLDQYSSLITQYRDPKPRLFNEFIEVYEKLQSDRYYERRIDVMAQMIDLGVDPLFDAGMPIIAAMNGDINVVEWLIATVESPQRLVMASASSGMTALKSASMCAVESAAVSIARLILQQGVPAATLVLTRGDGNESAMDLAVLRDYHDLLNLFLDEYRVAPDASSLSSAIGLSNRRAVQLLLKHADNVCALIEERDVYGLNALEQAQRVFSFARSGMREAKMIQKLISAISFRCNDAAKAS